MELKEALPALGLFDGPWYLERNPDVALSGMEPLDHFLLLGVPLGRAPGPTFDPQSYVAVYPDAAASDLPAVLHYMRHGIPELRIPGLVEAPRCQAAKHHLRWLAHHAAPERIARSYPSFDADREHRFFRAVDEILAAHHLQVDAIKASVIMPSFNRAKSIADAIESILAQDHQNWELLIIDDGSNDDTPTAVEPYLADPRIRLFRQPRSGVGAARNSGLEKASGDFVFYLDSDNQWTPRHLQCLMTYLWCTGLESAYSGLVVQDAAGKVKAYRGDHFCADQCLRANFVDLNAYCHSIRLFQQTGGFDPSLRRMGDWDLVLRHARLARPGYAPFIGCRYLDSDTDPGRISASQPYAYRRIVQARNHPSNPNPGTTPEGLGLRFAIKIPAPYGKRQEWGDFHFGESLAVALESLGHEVRIDFLEQWNSHKPRESDVVIVLRGLSRYEPHPEHVNILWNISHPDQVSYVEYEAFDIVYVASLSYPDLLRHIIHVTPRPLLQCTDPERFSLEAAAATAVESTDVLFVGNSRARRRPIVDWALASNLALRVHGTRWKGLIPDRHIASEHIANQELAAHYSAAGVVLNDHWESMADFGFLSNRLFDVLAAGGTLVSDTIPSIRRVFDGAVTEVDSAPFLAEVVSRLSAQGDTTKQRREISQNIHNLHSFPRRAAQLWHDVAEFLGVPNRSIPAPAKPSAPKRFRIHLLLQKGKRGPTSSGFIRLIAPLTTDAASSLVEIEILDGVDDPRLPACDACIVQRVAVPDMAQARKLVSDLARHDIPLYVDTDDAFGELPDTHPEQLAYRSKDEALRFLMANARQVWFATAPLGAMYSPCQGVVVSNNLDPRLWRNYRERPRKAPAPDEALNLLYMGTPTHDADFKIILAALDDLWDRRPESFELTLVRAVKHPPARPWLNIRTPPRAARSYPWFARWLGEQGPFDVGLAPLVDDRFNSAKSDIKILDYCALGLVSVVSDVEAYKATAPGAQFVVRCRNDPSAWAFALEQLMDNRTALPDLGAEARRYLWTDRCATLSTGRLLAQMGLAGHPAVH